MLQALRFKLMTMIDQYYMLNHSYTVQPYYEPFRSTSLRVKLLRAKKYLAERGYGR